MMNLCEISFRKMKEAKKNIKNGEVFFFDINLDLLAINSNEVTYVGDVFQFMKSNDFNLIDHDIRDFLVDELENLVADI